MSLGEIQRPQPKRKLTVEEMAIVASDVQLQQQAGLCLKARAQQFSEKFGREVKPYWIKCAYQAYGIHMQVIKKTMGNPNFRDEASQMEAIRKLQQQLVQARSTGCTIVQLDEATFYPHEPRKFRTYAHPGVPIRLNPSKNNKAGMKEYQAVCLAIDEATGVVGSFFPPLGKALNSDMYCTFVEQLVEQTGVPLFIFTDNMSAHTSLHTQRYLAEHFPDVSHIFNVPYRADLNGIEQYWLLAKSWYRTKIINLKAKEEDFDNAKIVRDIFERIEAEKPWYAKKCAQDGWAKLENATWIQDPKQVMQSHPVLELKKKMMNS